MNSITNALVTDDTAAMIAWFDADGTVKVFEGTHHGFCFAERAVYDPRAAEQTWTDIFNLWNRRLRS